MRRAAQLNAGFGPKAFKRYFNIVDPAVIQQRADAEVPLENVLESWAIGADTSVRTARLTELFDSDDRECPLRAAGSEGGACVLRLAYPPGVEGTRLKSTRPVGSAADRRRRPHSLAPFPAALINPGGQCRNCNTPKEKCDGGHLSVERRA
jgi:hypothetical protein